MTIWLICGALNFHLASMTFFNVNSVTSAIDLVLQYLKADYSHQIQLFPILRPTVRTCLALAASTGPAPIH